MKTEKYYMRAYLGDALLSTEVTLTKKEYTAKLKELDAQYLANCDTSNEFYLEKDIYTGRGEHTTVFQTVYSYGVNDVRLIKLVCDDGYYFTK